MSALSVSSVGTSPYYLVAQAAGQTGTASGGAGVVSAAPQGHHRHHHGGNAVADLLNSITNALNSAEDRKSVV